MFQLFNELRYAPKKQSLVVGSATKRRKTCKVTCNEKTVILVTKYFAYANDLCTIE